eukprot:TRINITY_DN1267_c0_g1_i2.p1 TRINITY_DN1267_c0_g1~~TRINITY_DN1267_c0_g1_i2.p1  ORF type:complete len:728 (-),score=159.12 TRINITY_DN1267_c0_g1_i2:55-2013(-)
MRDGVDLLNTDNYQRPPDFLEPNVEPFVSDHVLEAEFNRLQVAQPPMPQRDDALTRLFRSFIHVPYAQTDIPFNMNGDFGLSEREKAKIRDRTGIMARHIYSNHPQEFIDQQLDSFFRALEIPPQTSVTHTSTHPNDDFGDLEEHWRSTHLHPPMFNREPEMRHFRPREDVGGDWANEYDQHEDDEYEKMMQYTQGTQRWIEEYSHLGPLHTAPPHLVEQEERELREFDEIYERGRMANNFQRQWEDEYFNEDEEEAMENAWQDIGDDKFFENAWRESIGMAANPDLAEITGNITQINDPKLQNSNFMKLMSKIHNGEVRFEGNTLIENEHEWADEYASFKGSIDDHRLKEYIFVARGEENPFDSIEDPLSKGIQLFNDGLISEAILALETEVNRHPENSKAWEYLGQAHAENDKDGQAITCLAKAVEVDPQNLSALATLAVSYTNDFHKERALEALEQWVERHPLYKDIPIPNLPQEDFAPNMAGSYADTWKRHATVSQRFLEAARMRPEDPDPEVQTILGLLYNLSYEYDKAVDCFKAALTKRPDDYLLWNKLGATLANSNRSEEALGAYFKALEGKPTYVRARANLGISYLALNMYPEAARNFLGALEMHPEAQHIWDNLMMVFRLLGRNDLVEKCQYRDISLFSNEEF